MTGGFELAEPPPSPRSAVRKATFITIAGVLAIIGALVSTYYFAMRPVTLKIAVGPANSEDVRVVQALTQAFTQSHAYVRLRPVQTDGAVASADLLATLAGFSNFQDQLAMGFRRAAQIREPLSLVLVRVQPSPKLQDPREVSLAMGEAARALVRKLRTEDSLFLLSPGVFGIFLPNTARPGMHRVIERVTEGLIEASSSGNRFRFNLGMVNYPEQASTAREMEQLAYAFSFGTGSA